jgi:hypothetical protein
MRSTWFFGAILTGLLALMPGDVLGQKNNKNATNGTSRVATELEYQQLAQYPEFSGKLQSIDTATGSLSFTFDHAYLQQKANSGYSRSRSRRRPTANVTVKQEHIEFDLKMSPKVALRKQTLGMEYDSRGNVKEYTAEEKAKLRSAGLPGYKASDDELRPGSLVKLYLIRPKAVTAKAAKDDPTLTHPTVKMVLLLPDPNAPANAAAATPAKKKK